MNEQFIELLKQQLELEAKLDELHRRIGQEVRAERGRGNQDRILVAHEGQVYSIERPDKATAPDKIWHYHFRPYHFRSQGKGL